MAYDDYTKLLAGTNFVGGAGKNDLSTISGSTDVRADVTKEGTNYYQFYYKILGSKQDLDTLGYYPVNGREYTNLPTGQNPALSAEQTYIVQHVLHTSLNDAYSVLFEDVANVRFNAGTTVNADIIFGQTTSVSGAAGYEIDYSAGNNSSLQNIDKMHGDVWLDKDDVVYWNNTDEGNLGRASVIHEIGHAMGLDHVDAYLEIDSQKYSIMSYKPIDGMDIVGLGNETMPIGLQLLDIAALQKIYGKNYTTRSEDGTTYSKMTAFASSRPNEAFIYTIWDGGGVHDKIDASGFTTTTQGAIIDLRQGEFSSIGMNVEGTRAKENVAVAYHTIIEDAVGTNFDDVIIGNAWDNKIEGGSGNDRIFGDGVTIIQDSVVNNNLVISGEKTAGQGFGANDGNHDNFTGFAAALDGSGNDELHGGSGDDFLYGGAGNDILDGGVGADFLNGGRGNDTFIASLGNDKIYGDAANGEAGYYVSKVTANGNDVLNLSSLGTLDIYLGSFTYNTYANLDGSATGNFYQIEKVNLGDANDNINVSYITSDPFNITLDAGNGIDTVYFDMISTDIEVSSGLVRTDSGIEVKNIENISVAGSGSVIVNNLGYNYTLLETRPKLLTFDYSELQHSLTFNYINGTAVGNNITDQVNGLFTSAGRIEDGVTVFGSNYGDTVTLAGSYFLGAGNDTVNIPNFVSSYYSNSTTVNLGKIYYSGGNDVVNDVPNKMLYDVWLAPNIRHEDVVSVSMSAPTIVFSYSGHNAVTNITVNFSDGGSLVLKNNAGSVTTGSDGVFGTLDDVWVLLDNRTIRFYDGTYLDVLDGQIKGTPSNAVKELSPLDDMFTYQNNYIKGYSGNDVLTSTVAGTSIWGGSGNDIIHGTTGNDKGTRASLIGGFGNDTIYGYAGDDSISGGQGNDFLYGGDGNDIVEDAAGSNELYGGNGNDILRGGLGQDILDGGAGNDEIFGGNGADIFKLSSGADVIFGFNANEGDRLGFSQSAVLSVSQVTGSTRDFYNYSGTQFVLAAGTSVTLEGMKIEDISPTFFKDSIYAVATSAAETYVGGTGVDFVDYSSSNAGVNVDIKNNIVSGGYAAGDVLTGIENLIGSAYADVLKGDTGANLLDGGAANDQLYGDAGNDTISGNSGNDTLYGGTGNDILNGGSETDTAVYSGAYANYTINGSTVTDNVGTDGVDTISGVERLQFSNGTYEGGVFTPYSSDDIFIGTSAVQAFDGGTGFDTVNYSSSTAAVSIDLALTTAATGGYAQGDTFVSIESLIGSAYNDVLRGNAANEVFYGGLGNDTIKAQDGNDTLYGDAGVDTMEGNNGNDTLYGGAGADSLKGGAGVDKFVYLSVSDIGDTIVDFNVSAGEKIDLMAILQNSAGFVGTQAFTAGFLRAAQNGTSTNIYLDVDGSAGGGAEVLLATLLNVTSTGVTLSSFILPTSGSGASNTAPVANNDSASTNEDTAVTVSVLSNDSDANGDALAVSVLTGASKGLLVVNANNTITYTPNANTNGADSFTYQVNDGLGGTSNATVSLSVAAVNDAPVAFDDVYSGTQNTNITGNLLSNNGNGLDSDIDGDTLSVTAQTLATAHGSVVISANGGFTYTPTTGYSGSDTFNYTLSDGHGGSDTGAALITLTATSGIYGTSGNDTITGTVADDNIYGLAGNDTLKGGDGNDFLYGSDGVDYLEGNNGNDTLYGGAGADTLKGSGGVDTFVFQTMSDAGDTIQDYNYSAGEKLNIANILSLYHPLTDAITDFVQITQSGTNSILSIDVDGGANSFVQLATLTATSGLTDEQALVNAGRLIVV